MIDIKVPLYDFVVVPWYPQGIQGQMLPLHLFHIDGCLLYLYWCLLHLKALLVRNWFSRTTRFMPMGEAVECAVIDLKVAVIPLKDFYLAFNSIYSAGSRETKREELICLTLSVPCHLPVTLSHSPLCKSCLSLCSSLQGALWWCIMKPWWQILLYIGSTIPVKRLSIDI